MNVIPLRRPATLVDRTTYACRLAGDAALTGAAVRVGVLLALHFANGQSGRCDPGLHGLGRLAGLSRRHVIRAVVQLQTRGWLTSLHRRGTAGRGGATNAYMLNFNFVPPPSSGDTEVTGDAEDTGDSQGSEVVTPVSPEHRKEPGIGADAPQRLKSILWQGVKDSVCRLTGKDSGAAGRLVGKWVKDHGLAATVDAIHRAESEQPADPVAWIAGTLNAKARPKPIDRFRKPVWASQAKIRDAYAAAGLSPDTPRQARIDCLMAAGIDPKSLEG
jgi:hypothetical protein